LIVDPANLLLPLRWAEGSIGANRFNFGVRPLLEGTPLLQGRLGDAGYFPTRWLMRLRRTSNGARMLGRGRLNTNRGILRGCTLGYRSQNDQREQTSAEGERAFGHTYSSGGLNPTPDKKLQTNSNEIPVGISLA